MSTKNSRQEYYDGWAGLADEMAKQCKVQRSQCGDCENKIGTHACKVFGERPYKYSSVLANVPCPNREVK